MGKMQTQWQNREKLTILCLKGNLILTFGLFIYLSFQIKTRTHSGVFLPPYLEI